MRAATESSAHLFHSLVGLGVQHPVSGKCCLLTWWPDVCTHRVRSTTESAAHIFLLEGHDNYFFTTNISHLISSCLLCFCDFLIPLE